MKTKELIELLKKEDPSGELHVRMNGEGSIPHFVERKEGYWDGPSEYFDEDKNLVISTRGNKIDLYATDAEDFIWNNNGDCSKIKYDFTYAQEANEKRIAEYTKNIK